MFLGLLFRFMKSKLHYRALENQYGGFYFKKYQKFEIFQKNFSTKNCLVQLSMFYLFQNGRKLWKFGKIRVFS